MHVDVPPLVKSVFRKLEDVRLSDKSTYACHAVSDFGAVDALARIGDVLYGFQMTVSLDHPIKQRLLIDILDALKPAKMRLVFVVPEDCYASFQAQPYLSMKNTVLHRIDKKVKAKVQQWVLCMPIAAGW